MQHTLFILLTNKKGRHARDIRASLDREFIAGAPWFNVVQIKPQATKIDSSTK